EAMLDNAMLRDVAAHPPVREMPTSQRRNAEVRLTHRWRGESAANSSLKRPKFPASRENTGNFIDSRLGSASTAAKKLIKREPYEPIPCAPEQGIFCGLAGNFKSTIRESGNPRIPLVAIFADRSDPPERSRCCKSLVELVGANDRRSELCDWRHRSHRAPPAAPSSPVAGGPRVRIPCGRAHDVKSTLLRIAAGLVQPDAGYR